MSTQPPSGMNMNAPDNTYGLIGYGPLSSAPAGLNLSSLSDDELALVDRLSSNIGAKRYRLQLHDTYYRGEMAVKDLGISIPPQMRSLRAVLGWPRIAIDVLDERLDVEGFRYPESTDVDAELMSLWQANNLDAESQLAHIDALVFGMSYVAVGSGDGGPNGIDSHPIITVESPLDVAVEWDARTRRLTAGLRLYGTQGHRYGTLYLPDQTISVEQAQGGWDVVDRDVHKLGRVPLVRVTNRSRSYDRNGFSEITPELMSVTDSAIRTLLGLEVSREFYSAPQRYILGAPEAAFQDAAGNPKSPWETYMGRYLALEAGEAGTPAPTVGQFTAYDPSAFTKVLDAYAKIVCGLTGLSPHMLGDATVNPPSADAIRSADVRLKKKADRKTRMFGQGWEEAIRLALLIRDGHLPSSAASISTIWADTAIPTPAATADAMYKAITGGSIPATSDVTLERLGFDAVERARLAQDREKDQGASFLQEIAHSLTAKAARTDKTLTRDIVSPASLSGSEAPNVNPAGQ